MASRTILLTYICSLIPPSSSLNLTLSHRVSPAHPACASAPLPSARLSHTRSSPTARPFRFGPEHGVDIFENPAHSVCATLHLETADRICYLDPSVRPPRSLTEPTNTAIIAPPRHHRDTTIDTTTTTTTLNTTTTTRPPIPHPCRHTSIASLYWDGLPGPRSRSLGHTVSNSHLFLSRHPLIVVLGRILRFTIGQHLLPESSGAESATQRHNPQSPRSALPASPLPVDTSSFALRNSDKPRT